MEQCQYATTKTLPDKREVVACAKFNRNNSLGVCKGCGDNTTKGVWPDMPAKPVSVTIAGKSYSRALGPAVPPHGPGSELKKILDNLKKESGADMAPSFCTGCASRAATMNLWGVKRCQDKIEEITDWLYTATITAKGYVQPPNFDAALFRDLIRHTVQTAIDNAKAVNP